MQPGLASPPHPLHPVSVSGGSRPWGEDGDWSGGNAAFAERTATIRSGPAQAGTPTCRLPAGNPSRQPSLALRVSMAATVAEGADRREASKNGARLPIWRVTGGRGQAESPDVKLGISAASDPGPPAASTAEWRFGPSAKRQTAPFSDRSLPNFSGFFCELADPGANWRECDSQMRGRRISSTRKR